VATALRALVMLICLIVVPLAAVFGTSLPDVARRLLEGHWSQSPAVATENAEESPHYRTDPAGATPLDRGGRPQGEARSAEVLPATYQMPDPLDRSVEAAVWQGPGSPAKDASSRLLHAAAELAGQGLSDVGAGAAGSAKAELFGAPPGELPATELSTQPASPGSATDQFADAQKRLRQMGATYYLLEAWGSDAERFRFHCEMAIAGNPHHTRHFEKTDIDPMRAVARVLQEVEAWRSGR
jgi:hypothetical protein